MSGQALISLEGEDAGAQSNMSAVAPVCIAHLVEETEAHILV